MDIVNKFFIGFGAFCVISLSWVLATVPWIEPLGVAWIIWMWVTGWILIGCGVYSHREDKRIAAEQERLRNNG